MNHTTPTDVYLKLSREPGLVLLDVRTPREFEYRRIGAAINIPLDELMTRSRELDPEKEIIVICEHGIRSVSATGFLMQLGFENVWNMLGGMAAWSGETVSGKT
jgi:rhodanese-related sulfurtransferase